MFSGFLLGIIYWSVNWDNTIGCLAWAISLCIALLFLLNILFEVSWD
jgi:hypothetical protein